MANSKPKKTAKKSSTKPEVKETKQEVVATTVATDTTCAITKKGFWARKCDPNENVLTIFKTPRIWGALLGELIGTMLVMMLFLLLGLTQPIYLVVALIGVYIAVAGISGANLNPLVTAGMMATRRMSAIRGILYMLAQVLGAWLGLIVVNAFRLGSEAAAELPIMGEVTGDVFWAVALVELLGAMIIAFCFARALKFTRKNPTTFAITVTSGITLAVLLGIFIANGYFGFAGNAFMFNPAAALMYQILPTTADSFGELAGLAGLAVSAYVLIPMLGGILGFWISDIAARLSDGGYECDDYACACAHDHHHKHHEA